MEKIQELTEKILREGVEKGQAEADRIVKQTLRRLANPCTCPPRIPVCICGKKPKIDIITRKPLTASEEELAENADENAIDNTPVQE